MNTQGFCETRRDVNEGRVYSRSLLMLFVSLVVLPTILYAGKPEYMKLDAKPGQALEIKGYWDESNILVATDIEELPKPRKPKLRGEIQNLDTKKNTVTIFGMTIQVNRDTEFTDKESSGNSISVFKVGQRIEVACRVDDNGQWIARRIRSKGVKKSNKIKGTITRVAIDGKAPDTLDMSGLLILLNEKTDIDEPHSHIDRVEDRIFGDLSLGSSRSLTDGYHVNESVVIGTQYRQNIRSETEYDLSSSRVGEDQNNTESDVRVDATGIWNKKLRSYGQLRLRKRYIISSETTLPSIDPKLQITQLYMLARGIGGKGIALQVGRQDFDEPREWLFDEYLDAIRVYYYDFKPFIIEAAYIHSVSPMKEKSKTWTDYFLRVRLLDHNDNVYSAYMLSRRDSDIRKREPVWWGLRYYGSPINNFDVRVDMSIMRGEDKGQSLKAKAFDVSGTYSPNFVPLSPSISAGYAFASGDETKADGISNNFRQTGYQDNVDRFGRKASISYYGSMLDLELSNIEIISLGLGVVPTKGSSVSLYYYKYRQDFPDDKLRGSNLDAPPAIPNGFSDDIGKGLDIVVAVPTLWNFLSLKWTTGWFLPGDALEPRTNTAVLNKLNLYAKI